MKILICHNFYQSRGGEAQTVSRERALLEKKGNSVILYTRDSNEISDYSVFRKARLFFTILFSFKTYKALVNIIEQQRPDVAHIHNVFPLISPSVYYALAKHKIPIVQTLHNYRFLCPNGLFLSNKGEICEKCSKGNFFHAIGGKCYRNSYVQSFVISLSLWIHNLLGTFKKIDVYISPSHFLKNKMQKKGIPEEKILVKNHFVDTDDLIPSKNFENYVVFMGRLTDEKGILALIDALEKIPNCRLKIIGEGPLYLELKDFVERNKLQNIEFLGFIGTEKRYEILKKAMFLVLPSEWYENFPYVLIESLSLGIPAVASRIGGIPEIIDEGMNGLLVQSGNAEELKEKIERLIGNRDLLLSMRINAREKAEKTYGEEQGYRKLIEVYNRVLHK